MIVRCFIQIMVVLYARKVSNNIILDVQIQCVS